uniref:Uncharacterized protein n=1 Tax=Romanomermis culicivorax TaxID=13658 RepID=A0A915L8W6_ROMCU
MVKFFVHIRGYNNYELTGRRCCNKLKKYEKSSGLVFNRTSKDVFHKIPCLICFVDFQPVGWKMELCKRQMAKKGHTWTNSIGSSGTSKPKKLVGFRIVLMVAMPNEGSEPDAYIIHDCFHGSAMFLPE